MALRRWTPATVALLLSPRIADRMIARRVRGTIRADSFLALATPAVKVTSNRGVVRLVGQVRTDKERSSIVFKTGQTAGVEGIDDRITIGNGVKRAAW
jgi:osmotically-inducible protein OsmY